MRRQCWASSARSTADGGRRSRTRNSGAREQKQLSMQVGKLMKEGKAAEAEAIREQVRSSKEEIAAAEKPGGRAG